MGLCPRRATQHSCPGSCLWSASSSWSWRRPSVERTAHSAGRASAAGSRRRAVGFRPDPAQPPVTRVPGWRCGAGVPGAAGGPCPCVGPCLGTLTLRPLPGSCAGPGPGPPRPGRAGTGLLCSSGGPEGCWGNGTLLPFPPPPPHPPAPQNQGAAEGVGVSLAALEAGRPGPVWLAFLLAQLRSRMGPGSAGGASCAPRRPRWATSQSLPLGSGLLWL